MIALGVAAHFRSGRGDSERAMVVGHNLLDGIQARQFGA